jgi:ribosomal protein L30E
MTRTHTCTMAFALAFLFTSQTMAASSDSPVTRDHINAELAEAIRSGNIISGESSLKLNEQFPQNYPGQHDAPSKSREQVTAELAEAIRTGNIGTGESGQKLNEQFPYNFPVQQHMASKTRDQVNAELVQAVRTGQVGAYIEA